MFVVRVCVYLKISALFDEAVWRFMRIIVDEHQNYKHNACIHKYAVQVYVYLHYSRNVDAHTLVI